MLVGRFCLRNIWGCYKRLGSNGLRLNLATMHYDVGGSTKGPKKNIRPYQTLWLSIGVMERHISSL